MENSMPNPRVIFLTSSLSYRAEPFMEAARKLGLAVTRGLDMPPPLAEYWQATLPVDFKSPQKAAQDIFNFAARDPIQALFPLDEGATVLAAMATEPLHPTRNSSESACAARNKHRLSE